MAFSPTLKSYTEVSSWITAGASKGTASAVSWSAGDILVFIGGSEGPDTIGVPTATGLTFTSLAVNTAASTCGTRAAWAQAAADGSQTVSATNSSGTDHWGFGVWVFSKAQGPGTVSEAHASSQTVSLTPKVTGSAVVFATFDFTIGSLNSITPTPTNTRENQVDTSHYIVYMADLLPQTSPSAVSYGVSGADSTGAFSNVAVEIMGLNPLSNNYQSVKVGDGMSVGERIR